MINFFAIILNRFFYNPNNLSTSGYDFFNIFTTKSVTFNGHEKNFVLPQNIETFAVHKVTSGKPRYKIDPKTMYFNHYYFLNKKKRGKKMTKLQDKSILRHLCSIKK